MALTMTNMIQADFTHLMSVEFRAQDVVRQYEALKKRGYDFHPDMKQVLDVLAIEVRQRRVQ